MAIEYLNTSHVIFYLDRRATRPQEGGFKYISCYFLSFRSGSQRDAEKAFKYISCYFLSSVAGTVAANVPRFKYISCYFLSWHTSKP